MDFKEKDLFVVTRASVKFIDICINSSFTHVHATSGIGMDVLLNFTKAKPLLIHFLLTTFMECNAITGFLMKIIQRTTIAGCLLSVKLQRLNT